MSESVASRAMPPAEVTRFVGRRHELTEAKHLFSARRMVTITGVGGVGKTRLALRLANDLQRAFRDGVCVVQLAELRDPALLSHTVAEAMGLREQSNQSRVYTLSSHLAAKHLLLILDNCEHLVEGCATLVDELLGACPDLHLLATSRQPIGNAGESVLPLNALSVPDPYRPPPLEALTQYDGVNLFLDRAQCAVPSFTLTEENHVAVARLCHALDGLPLALELAAVRLRALSPAQILERLTDRYNLLAHGTRGAPTRQRTLRACIDWSFDLCSREERQLWARLAVFSGGFELDAAEGICSGDGLPREAILDLVAALVDKSILAREEHGSHVRYRLLETIRQYGEEKLGETQELSKWRGRHRAWFAGLVADAARDWVGPRQPEWIGRLRRNHANLRVALEFDKADTVGAATAVQIAADLEHYWFIRGSMSEARHLLDLALASGAGSDETRARALYVDAYAATLQGDVAVATQLLNRATSFAKRSGDSVESSYVAQGRGLVAMYQDDLSGAIVLLESALPALHAAGELAGEALTLFLLGTSIGLCGDTERAVEVHRRCLALMEPRGESWNCALALWALGVEAWRQGDGQAALALERQSLRIKTQLDDQLGIAACLQALAWIEGTEQHGESAAVMFGAADTIWRAIGMSLSALPAWFAYHTEGEKAARRIGERLFQAAFRRGSEMTLSEAIAFGLGEKVRTSAADSNSGGSAAKLTKRQLEIAHLIGEGLSNREIASRLVIAQSTAEGHVEQIFMKLGFTSRSQVAAWVAERRVDHSS